MKKYQTAITLTLMLWGNSSLFASEKPNFLFIFADDQSYETIGAHGNPEINTPHIDRLSDMGTSFTNTYNMGGWNGAICVAARTMMNTGKMVWRARAAEKELDQAAERGELWSQLLAKSGYETYCTGKWHVKIDPKKIFDHHVHERPGMPVDAWTGKMRGIDKPTPEFIQSLDGYSRPMEGEPDVWSPYERSFGGYWEGGKHWSEVLADDAAEFLENAARSEKPFFMYLAFNAPHDPRQSPKRFVDMYPLDEIKMPESYVPMYPYKDEIGCGPTLRDEALAPFPRTEFAVKTHRQEYYAIVSHMDEQIGRILEALDKTGKRDNTYIIFSADHGLACGNHGLIGKQNMYDHSLKPPLIVVGPDVPENEKRDALVYLQDIMATTLDLAGVNKPKYVEFNSLMPLIENANAASPYEAIYGAYLDSAQRMIRVGNMKLIVYPEAKRVRLFNLKEDPQEIDDLATDPAQWSTIKDLFGRLLVEQKIKEDPLNLGAIFPDLVDISEAEIAWNKLVESGVRVTKNNAAAFEYVEPDPELPNVLIYGDSISIGYTPRVREALADLANVIRLHRNGSDSGKVISFVDQLQSAMWSEDLEDGWDFQWDVIHFNVGLHDLKYLHEGKLNKDEGQQVSSLKTYASNLREIVLYFQSIAPDAKLVFATTTPVPEGAKGRFQGDAEKYNDVAREVLKEFPEVQVNDLYSFTKPNQTVWWSKPGNVHFNEVGIRNQGSQVAKIIGELL